MNESKNNLELWDKVKSVPEKFTKKINGGRIGGMTDIKPQWRLLKLTEQFGACGIGWYYETKKREILDAPDGSRSAHVTINLYIKDGEKWGAPIEGQGGSMLIAKEKSGLYHSDECYKMATTDALSVACKQLGIGADVYMGCGVSKYEPPKEKPFELDAIKKTISQGFDECKKLGYEFQQPKESYLVGDAKTLAVNLTELNKLYKKLKG